MRTQVPSPPVPLYSAPGGGGPSGRVGGASTRATAGLQRTACALGLSMTGTRLSGATETG